LILEDYDEVHNSKKSATKITLKDTKEYVKRPMILIFLLLTAGMNGAFLSSILAEITNIAYESGIEPHLAATILTYSLFLELIARPMWSALTSWFSAIFLLTAAIFVALISQVILVSAGSNYMLFTVGLLLFSIAVSGFSRCYVDNSRRP